MNRLIRGKHSTLADGLRRGHGLTSLWSITGGTRSERETPTIPDLLAGASTEDSEFVGLFAETAEFAPDHRKYGAYVSFNLRAVERGQAVVKRLCEIGPIEGSCALDIGAGSGGLAIALAKAGVKVSAIEPDPVRLRWAEARIRGHGVDVKLTCGAAEKLSFADATFDIVTLDSVIEHVENPAQVVREAARVLRPNGVIYVVSPNKSSVINIIRDPHYEMLGVVLMPRGLAKPYVEHIRGVERGYWVNVTPSKRWLIRRFAAQNIRLEQLDPDGFDKLRTPELVRHSGARRAAAIAKSLHLTGVLRRFLLAQYPAFVLLGRKAQ